MSPRIILPNRKERMYEFSATVLAEKTAERAKLIYSSYQENQVTITKEYLTKYSQVFTDVIEKQQAGLKQPIQWICTSYLRSSIIAGKPKLHIGLYDEQYLLDETAINDYWPVEFLQDGLQEDVAYLAKKLKGEFVRVMDYEIKAIANYYMQQQIFIIAQEICTELLPKLLQEPSYLEMVKKTPVHFTYGEYMALRQVIYSQGDETNGILSA